MTEEIKILLDILNKVKDYDDKRYFISCGENDYLLTNDEIKALLNYITNLQKENLKLISENEAIKSIKYTVDETIYKSRNKKAIEYIKQHCEIIHYQNENIDKIGKVEGIPLLNILQGGDE